MKLAVDGTTVQYIEHRWIEMSDGVRLSATLWMPEPLPEPVPALLEIIPYRKRDHTAARDFQAHSFFAARGYVSLRVDMRGHGDSEGLHDPHRTYADAVEIVAWLRAQPWCSGRIGMVGLSWGGTNAFMAASRCPPGLDAIVTCASSHDRYGVGMLWKNGCLLNENFAWVVSLSAFSTRPPDPLVVGEGWRELWHQRLHQHQPEAPNMLARQRRDEYWDKHLATDLEQMRAAVYMFSGWADNNYAQTPPTLLPRLSRPHAAVLGPWGHKYPHQGFPGPAIDFLSQATEWFDRHLRDRASGAENPLLTVFISEDLPARAQYPQAQGRWAALPALPSEQGPHRELFLHHGSLSDGAAADGELRHRSPLATGMASGEVMPWFAQGPGPELPGDQREDDGKSLCFDTPPLQQPLEFVGRPKLTLEFSVDRPIATLAVRLCDVKPDGESARVSLGLFNLNHRPEVDADDRNPRKLIPGKRYRMTLPLDFGAYRFRAGHRLRLAISTSYWPMVWPAPEPVTITVHLPGSALRLPLHRPSDEAPAPVFGAPRVGASVARTEHQPPTRVRSVSRDVLNSMTTVHIEENNGPYRLDAIDWTVSSRNRELYRIADDDPSSAQVDIDWQWHYSRGDWSASTRVRASLSCSVDTLNCKLIVTALERDQQFFEREWTYDIPRDHL